VLQKKSPKNKNKEISEKFTSIFRDSDDVGGIALGDRLNPI
jgi:hypothetical protein